MACTAVRCRRARACTDSGSGQQVRGSKGWLTHRSSFALTQPAQHRDLSQPHSSCDTTSSQAEAYSSIDILSEAIRRAGAMPPALSTVVAGAPPPLAPLLPTLPRRPGPALRLGRPGSGGASHSQHVMAATPRGLAVPLPQHRVGRLRAADASGGEVRCVTLLSPPLGPPPPPQPHRAPPTQATKRPPRRRLHHFISSPSQDLNPHGYIPHSSHQLFERPLGRTAVRIDRRA